MYSKKLLGTLAVSAALVGASGAVTVTAQAAVPAEPASVRQIDDSGSFSSSGTLARDAAWTLVCVLTGKFVGSVYPPC
ncbi:hypothetical protein [Nocardia sp. NPDC005978]|uniref:hypothetical protein n=1 Tax=unclassified Nocardia TaxID=2637762 RepID=UPI0033BE2D0C